jgi:hypothetical protein
MVAKSSRFDDESWISSFPVVRVSANSQEECLQEDGHSLKPQARRVFKPIKTMSSDLKQVPEEDTSSGSEHDLKKPSFKLGHDSRASSFEGTIKDSRSGSGHTSIESSVEIPAPALTLSMRPRSRLTCNLFHTSHDATFNEDETTSHPQILPREAAVDTSNHDSTAPVTPMSYPSSAALPSPPPVPRQTDREDSILNTCVSEELHFPILH